MELIEYVRENRGPRKGQLRGVVVANHLPDHGVRIGWSYTRTTAQKKSDGKIIPPDRFNKAKALMIARARLVKPTSVQVPHDVDPVLRKMHARCQRYFQGLDNF